MKVLVTGGAGFIGSHLSTALVRDGHRVSVLDNLSTGKRDNLAHVQADVELRVGDVRDKGLVLEMCRGCDVVFHEAAIVSVPYSVEHPDESHDVNIGGTLSVLLAARAAGVRRVIFACSAAVYGEEPTLPKREDMLPTPVSPYGIEKLTGEYYLKAWPRLYGVETVSLRYFNVFGPRQDPKSPYSGVISIFVDRALSGRSATAFGDGSQTRDFVFVDNVVQANLLAATREGVSGGVFNVGCGEQTSLVSLWATISRHAGTSLPLEFGPPRAGDIKDSVADITRARADLGYEPRVGLDAGLAELVGYVRGAGA